MQSPNSGNFLLRTVNVIIIVPENLVRLQFLMQNADARLCAYSWFV